MNKYWFTDKENFDNADKAELYEGNSLAEAFEVFAKEFYTQDYLDSFEKVDYYLTSQINQNTFEVELCSNENSGYNQNEYWLGYQN